MAIVKKQSMAQSAAEKIKWEAYRELKDALPFRGDGADWALPAKGGYRGGCETGTAAALAYLKWLREINNLGIVDGYPNLQSIVLDMLGPRGKHRSLRGQVVGFFSQLGGALSMYASMWSELDKLSFATLSEEVQKGLARTKADDLAELRRINSEIARRGWETRRRNARVRTRKPRMAKRSARKEAAHG